MGCFFTAMVLQGAWRTIQTYGWEKTTCRMQDGFVTRAEGDSGNYEFRPRYSYEAGGSTREGTVYKPGYSGSSQAGDAEALKTLYSQGASVPCYVSGDDPDKSALERPSLWTLLIVLFPLIFVAVGAGGLLMTWSPRPKPEELERRAISRKSGSPLQAAGCLAAFFGVFLLFGLGMSLFFALPALKVVKARSWREVPCTVLESNVRSHSGKDSTTYSVDILYEYEAGGRMRRSNRYEFLGGSSGGSADKAADRRRESPGDAAVLLRQSGRPRRRRDVSRLVENLPGGSRPAALRGGRGGRHRLRVQDPQGRAEEPATRALREADRAAAALRTRQARDAASGREDLRHALPRALLERDRLGLPLERCSRSGRAAESRSG